MSDRGHGRAMTKSPSGGMSDLFERPDPATPKRIRPVRDLSLIPMAMRPRFVFSTSPALANPPTTTDTTHVHTDHLPGDWQDRFWCLAELRGYRAQTASLVVGTRILDIHTEGQRLYQSAVGSGTDEGFAVEAQSGPLDCYWPYPEKWSGSTTFTCLGDGGAIAYSFRLISTLIELTEPEWVAMWGRQSA